MLSITIVVPAEICARSPVPPAILTVWPSSVQQRRPPAGPRCRRPSGAAGCRPQSYSATSPRRESCRSGSADQRCSATWWPWSPPTDITMRQRLRPPAAGWPGRRPDAPRPALRVTSSPVCRSTVCTSPVSSTLPSPPPRCSMPRSCIVSSWCGLRAHRRLRTVTVVIDNAGLVASTAVLVVGCRAPGAARCRCAPGPGCSSAGSTTRSTVRAPSSPSRYRSPRR